MAGARDHVAPLRLLAAGDSRRLVAERLAAAHHRHVELAPQHPRRRPLHELLGGGATDARVVLVGRIDAQPFREETDRIVVGPAEAVHHLQALGGRQHGIGAAGRSGIGGRRTAHRLPHGERFGDRLVAAPPGVLGDADEAGRAGIDGRVIEGRRAPGDGAGQDALATASPATFTSPSAFDSEHSRSISCSPSSLRLPLTTTREVSTSPGHVCLVKRTL